MFASSLTGAVLLTATLLGAPRDRVWTDTQGRNVTGTFVKQKDGQVTLRVNGRNVELPLTKLSQEDRDFIEAEELFPSALKPRQSSAGGSANETGDPEDDSAGNSTGGGGTKPKKISTERLWTDASGQSMRGRFVRMHDGKAVIQGAKIVSVPFHSLAAEDKEYLTELLEARGEAQLIPPVPTVIIPAAPQYAGGPQINPGMQAGSAGGGMYGSQPDFSGANQGLRALQERIDREQAEARSRFEAERQRREAEARQRDEQRRREETERQQRYVQQQQEAERQRQEMNARMRSDAERMASGGQSGLPSNSFASTSVPNFNFPMVEQYQCEGCKHVISTVEAANSHCPYCGIYWARRPAGAPAAVSWGAGSVGSVGYMIGVVVGLLILLAVVLGPIVGGVYFIRWLFSRGRSRGSRADYAGNYGAAAQVLTKPSYASNPYQTSGLDPSALIPLDDFSNPAPAPGGGSTSSPYQ